MQKTLFYLRNIITSLLTILILTRIIYLTTIKNPIYQKLYDEKTSNIIEGYSAPRGRILDTNGIVLVDNYAINIITYRDLKNDSLTSIDLAKSLLNLIDYQNTATEHQLKNYYIEENDKYHLLTDEEIKKYQERKLTKDDIYSLKLERITPTHLNTYNEEMQKAISIYYLMNQGYSYETKIIKERQVTDEECALINESNLPGITCELSWVRRVVEPAIASIYGKVGLIPTEDKEYYLSLGYNLDDYVGLSYLERQYDEQLKGTKNKYLINDDNSLTLVEEGSRGNDLTLSIDIELTKEINDIIDSNLVKATTLHKTDYFNSAFAIVSDPNTGAIIAMTGRQILKDLSDYTIKDITSQIINTSYTVGSVIKGASHTVGYQNSLITPGKKILDACVKLKFVPEKCSYQRRGYIDDITALKTSSNYYQFLLAISLTNQKYTYNMDLNATETHFNIYRNTFASFGLGSLTGIDLPGETTGIKGTTIADDLYLNLSIGQYDTYTPIALTQYINTIATNGVRHKLNLMQSIGDITNNKTILNTIEDTGYFQRIKEGFHQVINGGTGNGYVNHKYNAAGKTGTSETYYQKGITSITQTFAAFAPLDSPKYSVVILTPNVSYYLEDDEDNYTAPINRYISSSVTQLVFENY